MGMFDKIGKAISTSANTARNDLSRVGDIKKCESQIVEIENKYTDNYILIGKRVTEFMRAGEKLEDPKIKVTFDRITKLDDEKAELEATLKSLKSEMADSTEAADTIAMEEELEKGMAKCKELLDMGVDSQSEYNKKVEVLQNKMKNFKPLRALDLAYSKNLLTKEDYNAKRVALLGDSSDGLFCTVKIFN